MMVTSLILYQRPGQQNFSSFFAEWYSSCGLSCQWPLCQCRSSKSFGGDDGVEVTTRRAPCVWCGCLLSSVDSTSYYSTISEIYASIVCCDIRLNSELLNTISAELRPRLAHLSAPSLPNRSISRCIHLAAHHSSHLTTCGRISCLMQPPVRPNSQNSAGSQHRTDSSEFFILA